MMPSMFLQLGRMLVFLGLALALVGGLLVLFHYLPLGRLPGDLRWERPGFRIHVPIATMIIVSIVLTVVLNVALSLWFRRPQE